MTEIIDRALFGGVTAREVSRFLGITPEWARTGYLNPAVRRGDMRVERINGTKVYFPVGA
jgi:hypothetical protein